MRAASVSRHLTELDGHRASELLDGTGPDWTGRRTAEMPGLSITPVLPGLAVGCPIAR
jgi:hypothetical protein